MEQNNEPNVSTNVGTDTNTDTSTNTDTNTAADTSVEPGKETNVTNDVEKPIMIPKNRFDDVNNKYKQAASEMEALKQQKEAMEKELAALKQTSEQTTSQVNEAAEQLKGKVEHYEGIVKEMVDTKVAAIPEEYHELIPEGLSDEQKLSWINKAEAKGLFKKEEKKQVEIGSLLNHSSEQDNTERMKKMNPIQLLASYYSTNN